MHFAGFTIVNTGALTDVNTHRNDGTFFNDNAFNHFGTRANEAVVFDDGRVSLQGFQNATNADAAGEVNVFTDLRAGAYRCPVSTIVPSST